MAKKKDKDINSWVPSNGQKFVDNDGSLFIVRFD